MTLTCECEHARKDHHGGSNYNDRSVLECGTKDCKCKKYHANKEAVEAKTSLYYKIGLYISVIIIGAVISGVGINYAVGSIIDDFANQYDIKEKYQLYDKYVNGTEKKHVYLIGGNDVEPGASYLKDELQTISVMFVFFASFGLIAVIACTMFEPEWKRLINQ